MKKFTLILAALITSIVMAGCTPFGGKSHENRGHHRHHAKQGRAHLKAPMHRRGFMRFQGRFNKSQEQEKGKQAPSRRYWLQELQKRKGTSDTAPSRKSRKDRKGRRDRKA